ncbi:MAG: hypothetical protein U1E76_03210 [Planctomycetota bacterium]
MAIVAAANVLLLVGMFWVGYLRGKAAARSEATLAQSGAAGPELSLRQDAKQTWDVPARPGAAGAGPEASKESPGAPASQSSSEPQAGKPEARNIWVVQANSYAVSRKDVALTWKKTLTEKGFAGVEVYMLGEKNPMLGLCVGASAAKDKAAAERELDATLQKVRQFTSKDEHPFEGAIVTQIAVRK